jgi:hypothetical protein
MISPDLREDDEVVRAILRRQYAYFAYRSMECLGNMAAGVSRVASEFDREAKALARTLSLMLKHGSDLPDYTEVLVASEALNGLLFHASVCHRELYWPLLVRTTQRCFSDLLDPSSARSGETAKFVELFARIVSERGASEAPVNSPRFDQLSMQVDELAREMRQEALHRTRTEQGQRKVHPLANE